VRLSRRRPSPTSTAVRVYRLLLKAYPPAFRAAYARDLEQLFADVWRAESARGGGLRRFARVWGWALRDTLTSAPAERINAMRSKRGLLLLSVALLVGLGIGLVDTRPHWDDTGITVGALLAATGAFGLIHPRNAWLWALAVGIWIPVLNIAQTHNAGSILALAFAFAGAYAGAFGRRLAQRAA
jgi:hypothetical protein